LALWNPPPFLTGCSQAAVVDGGPAQIWTVNTNGEIVNNHSGLCLADKGANTTNGNPIWVYTCDGGPAQLWKTPASQVDPSGEAMPVGDLPGWRQIFTDNFATTSDFNVGDVGASVGTFNIQDAATLTANAFFVGSANSAGSTASGTVNQTGGTVTALSTTTGNFSIGGRTSVTSVGGVGTYNLSGGTLSAASALRVGAIGLGSFNQSGGTVIASGGVDIAAIAGASAS
jgi:hypothetical protein